MRLLKWIDEITKNHKKEKGVKKRFTLTTKGYREFKDLTECSCTVRKQATENKR